MYQIPLEEIKEFLKSNSCRKILIEAPIGLKSASFQLCNELKGSYDIVISGDYVWGFCDTDVNSLKDYDIIIHLAHELGGHAWQNFINYLNAKTEHYGEIRLIRINDKYIMYVPTYYEVYSELLSKAIEISRNFCMESNVKLITYSLPFKKYAEKISSTLGIECSKTSVLGCFVGFKVPKRVLIISSGYFHALTLKLTNPEVKVYLLDIFRLRIEDVDQIFKKYLTIKLDMFFKACSAKSFAVLLCTKIGQRRLDLVNYVVEKLRSLDKQVYIVQVSNVQAELINNLPVDVVVNTACPRIGFDDLDRFVKPVINTHECEYLDKPEKYEITSILKW